MGSKAPLAFYNLGLKMTRNRLTDRFWFLTGFFILASGFLLIKLIDNYVETEGLMALDMPIYRQMTEVRSPGLNRLMVLITTGANLRMVAWGEILFGLLLLAEQRKRLFLSMVMGLAGGGAFITFLKFYLERGRPPVESALIQVNGYAFPSWHGYFAVVFYGLVVYYWWQVAGSRWKKMVGTVLGTGWIIALAFSRIYLGVHWTTDVLAGMTAAGVWLGLTIVFLEYKKDTPRNVQTGEVVRAERWLRILLVLAWLLGWWKYLLV